MFLNRSISDEPTMMANEHVNLRQHPMNYSSDTSPVEWVNMEDCHENTTIMDIQVKVVILPTRLTKNQDLWYEAFLGEREENKTGLNKIISINMRKPLSSHVASAQARVNRGQLPYQ